jgi:glycosyltransferase involved in cell wall biosynthesis
MKILVTLENRFYKSPAGKYYSNNIFDYSVWKKYLSVFHEVVICARVENIDYEMPEKMPANGPNVSFFELPMYVGLKQYLKKHFILKKRIQKAVYSADTFMLRIPGRISSLLWYELVSHGISYGVEVVGSVEDSLDTCGINPLLKRYLKWTQGSLQKNQCQRAAVSAYVSKEYLQKKYPPGGWSTHYSSIDLPQDVFLDDLGVQKKVSRIQQAIEGKRPFRICHAGTMGAMYKAQDDLIEAISLCRHKGFDVELVLMGDGKCRSIFEAKAKRCGIENHVKFLGNVSAGQSVRNEYDKSDLLVFPSLTEGLPRVPIEAMARGLTCIATNVGGIPELIPQQRLVFPRHPHDLAEKIQEMLSNPYVLKDQINENLKKSQEYSLNVLTQRRNKCYEKLIKVSQQNMVK